MVGAPFKPFFGLSGIPRTSTAHCTGCRSSWTWGSVAVEKAAGPAQWIPLKPKYGLNGAPTLVGTSLALLSRAFNLLPLFRRKVQLRRGHILFHAGRLCNRRCGWRRISASRGRAGGRHRRPALRAELPLCVCTAVRAKSHVFPPSSSRFSGIDQLYSQ